MEDTRLKKIKQITQSIVKYADEYQVIIQLIIFGVGAFLCNFYSLPNISVLIVIQLLSLSISLKQRQLSEEKIMDLMEKSHYVSEPINLNEFVGSAKKEVYCYSVFGAWLTDRKQEIKELCQNNVRVHIMIGASPENYTQYAKVFSTDEILYKEKAESYKVNLRKFESDIRQIRHYVGNGNLEVRCVNRIFPCSFFAKDPDQQNGLVFWREYLPPTKQNKVNSYHGYFIRQSDVFYSSYIGYIRELWNDSDDYKLDD